MPPLSLFFFSALLKNSRSMTERASLSLEAHRASRSDVTAAAAASLAASSADANWCRTASATSTSSFTSSISSLLVSSRLAREFAFLTRVSLHCCSRKKRVARWRSRCADENAGERKATEGRRMQKKKENENCEPEALK